MVAAGQQIRGQTIADNMFRLTSASGTPYDVGTDKLNEAFSFLAVNPNNKINLTGANGRPQWKTGGGRETPASIWCLNTPEHAYVPDVLSYDQGSGMLTGTFPSTCFTFPAPAP